MDYEKFIQLKTDFKALESAEADVRELIIKGHHFSKPGIELIHNALKECVLLADKIMEG